MPIQNTFTLVPTAASIATRSPSGVRPMTSKQVSKAYKAANRMPKMSRAERMKQERAEQERIRKELEREKSAAKAKIARDKKKEQERAEREERKRNGRPLIDVRASQNTMTSFFTRGPPLRKREEAMAKPLENVAEEPEEELESELEPDLEPQVVPEAGPLTEDENQPQHVEPEPEILDKVEEEIPAIAHMADIPQDPALDDLLADDIEDEGEELVPEPELEMRPQPAVVQDGQPQNLDPELKPLDKPEEETATVAPTTEPPQDQALGELLVDDLNDDDFDLLWETEDIDLGSFTGAALQIHAKSLDIQDKAPESVKMAPPAEPPRMNTIYERDLGLNAKKRKLGEYANEERLESNAQQTKPASPKQQFVAPMAPPPRPQPQPPPLSTQYIMYDFDDFFPTASQQVRELEEEQAFSSLPKAPAPISIPQPVRRDRTPSPPQHWPSPAASPTSLALEPKSPKRFFTASGSQEGLSLALHRSRKSAALEALQQRDRMRIEAGLLQQQEEMIARQEQVERARKAKNAQLKTSSNTQPRVLASAQAKASVSALPKVTTSAQIKAPTNDAMAQKKPHSKTSVEAKDTKKSAVAPIDKENIPPQIVDQNASIAPLSASQETDYGGRWLDEIPLDIDF